MNKKEALKIYNEQIEKIRAYSLMMATVSFDRSTVAPSKGNDYRNRMMSIISGEAFAIETDPKFIEAVLYLSKLDLGETANRDIALAKKELEDTIKFTKEESMAYALASMEGYDSWYKAKTTDDYSVFEPKLLNLIELTKQRAHKRKPEMKAYNVMLDDFEEGMNTERYDEFFALIKKELLPLIKKIDKKKDYINDSFLYKYYPAEKQAIFMKEVLKYLGFDRSWGYMGETEHPFTSGFSRNDVRITTNYDEHNVAGAVFSTVHESGHAFYEHQVDPKYDRYLFLHA
ncbi:MAG: carboxypeptidase M32, partial [Erysipelotrichaceae bacterium]|nr:carboxypeptidase M32 [Erysipelotrichaceae bacterium]